MTEGRRLVVFDLCDTLYAANTTFAFIEDFARRAGRPKLARSLERWSSRRSPFFYLGAVALRFFGSDLARRRAVAALRGERRDTLETAAARFTTEVLEPLANRQVMERLIGHREAGDEVLIVSASLDIVVAPIARKLGVPFVGSRLGFDGDVCNGRIEEDLTGRKSSVVKSRLEGGARTLEVFTDNRSDADLVAMAGKSTIILPSYGSKLRWGGGGSDYIDL